MLFARLFNFYIFVWVICELIFLLFNIDHSGFDIRPFHKLAILFKILYNSLGIVLCMKEKKKTGITFVIYANLTHADRQDLIIKYPNMGFLFVAGQPNISFKTNQLEHLNSSVFKHGKVDDNNKSNTLLARAIYKPQGFAMKFDNIKTYEILRLEFCNETAVLSYNKNQPSLANDYIREISCATSDIQKMLSSKITISQDLSRVNLHKLSVAQNQNNNEVIGVEASKMSIHKKSHLRGVDSDKKKRNNEDVHNGGIG